MLPRGSASAVGRLPNPAADRPAAEVASVPSRRILEPGSLSLAETHLHLLRSGSLSRRRRDANPTDLALTPRGAGRDTDRRSKYGRNHIPAAPARPILAAPERGYFRQHQLPGGSACGRRKAGARALLARPEALGGCRRRREAGLRTAEDAVGYLCLPTLAELRFSRGSRAVAVKCRPELC